jgi:hypothetical protein
MFGHFCSFIGTNQSTLVVEAGIDGRDRLSADRPKSAQPRRRASFYEFSAGGLGQGGFVQSCFDELSHYHYITLNNSRLLECVGIADMSKQIRPIMPQYSCW